MNQNLEREKTNITPYKATGNLNTAISNPSININDTMNINIQNVGANEIKPTAIDNTNINTNQNTVATNEYTNVEKQYIEEDNNKKKKNLSFKMGPKFKIALLIIVVLLVFVLLLPVISNMFRGY